MAPGLVPARLGVLGILVAFLPWSSLRGRTAPSAMGRRTQRRSCRPRRQADATDRLAVSVEAHVTVSALLTEKRRFLEQLARRLLEKEVVERDELQALLAGAKLS